MLKGQQKSSRKSNKKTIKKEEFWSSKSSLDTEGTADNPQQFSHPKG